MWRLSLLILASGFSAHGLDLRPRGLRTSDNEEVVLIESSEYHAFLSISAAPKPTLGLHHLTELDISSPDSSPNPWFLLLESGDTAGIRRGEVKICASSGSQTDESCIGTRTGEGGIHLTSRESAATFEMRTLETSRPGEKIVQFTESEKSESDLARRSLCVEIADNFSDFWGAKLAVSLRSSREEDAKCTFHVTFF